MRRSTIQKLFLNSPLLTTSVVVGLIIWLVLEIPIFIGTYYLIQGRAEESALSERRSLERVLLSVFESEGRFGDLVLAKSSVLLKGKEFGLKNFVICDGNSEVLASFREKNCTEASLDSYSIVLADKKYDVNFRWEKFKFSLGSALLIAFSISAAIAAILIFLSAYATYYFAVKKVRAYSERIAFLALNEKADVVDSSMPELLVLEDAIGTMRRRIDEYHATVSGLETKAAIADLASQVSHDIRSPLSVINMVFGGIKGSVDPEVYGILTQAVQRINGIAGTLLHKGSESKGNHASGVEVSKVVIQIVEEKKLQYLENKNIVFNLNVGFSDVIKCDISELELGRLVSNLLNNSVEALVDGAGEIDIVVSLQSSLVVVQISDNGVGMPEEILSKIGTQGFSYNKRNEVSGSGLGIYHAKKVVEATGGRFSVFSKLGKGTLVTVAIPIS